MSVRSAMWRSLLLAAAPVVVAFPACNWSPVQDLRFACESQDQCADGYVCRGGECQLDDGSGGGGGGGGGGSTGCAEGQSRVCAVAECTQSCVDGGFGTCAPVSGASLDSNVQHCGECGRVCGSGRCVSSRCTCAKDSECPVGTRCGAGGLCVLSTDPCATVRCPAGEVCRAGTCGATTCADGCGVGETCETDAGTCRALSACRVPEACGDGGVCEGIARPDGEACDDGNACSRSEVCAAGWCVGVPYSCPAPTPCQQAVACDGDGGCLVVDRNEGDPCDDGVACTSNDLCTAKVCAGTPGTSYQDLDGDGHGDSASPFTGCPAPAGYVGTGGDCNDGDPDVFQSVLDLVVDLDADGYSSGTPGTQCVGAMVTVGGRTYYEDLAGTPTWLLGTEVLGTDCNDSAVNVYQTVTGLVTDVDQDGYTTGAAASQCVGNTSSAGGRTYYRNAAGLYTWVAAAGSLGTDCNDTNASTTGPSTYYLDGDTDGYGTTSQVSCTQPVGYAPLGGDCDDTNASIYQAVASLVTDADHDGYTLGTAASQCVGGTSTFGGRTYYRGASGSYFWFVSASSLGTDCDDADPLLMGQTTWYRDLDGDGYGGTTTQVACLAPGGYVALPGDCNDNSPNVYRTISGLATDSDQDGYYVGTAASQCVGSSTSVGGRTYYRGTSGNYSWINSGVALGSGDCSDTDGDVYRSVANLLPDEDADGYPANDNPVTVCVGNLGTIGGRTYYRNTGGNLTWLLKTDCIGRQGNNCPDLDCYDQNAAARLGQTAWFTVDRGDGSFDYNCSGAVVDNQSGTYCSSVSTTEAFSSDAACTVAVGSYVLCPTTAVVVAPASCGRYLTGGTGFYFSGTCVPGTWRSNTQIGCH
ncbi:MAG: hypothetical protein ACYC8T_15995 [Myxococcaceae bacterium]